MQHVFDIALGCYSVTMHRQTRRSRMRRTPTGKRIELSARDIEIFKLLERYRYLRSTFLYSFVGGRSETRFKERLGDLYHEAGFIDRPAEQWRFAESRCATVVYETTDAARLALRQLGFASAEKARGYSGARRQFIHTRMISEVVASIELASRMIAGLRFITWQEILARSPQRTRDTPNPLYVSIPAGDARGNTGIVPDALFGLEYTTDGKRTYRFFALEADRAMMPIVRSGEGQTAYFKKIIGYREILERQLHKTHFGIPNLLVLTVTTAETHMQNMLMALREANVATAPYLFKVIGDDLVTGGMTRACPSMLITPWKRSGYPALCVARE